MQKISGSITAIKEKYTDEHMMFTYSEEEKQQNEINASNAKLIFNWKYLVIPREVFSMGLSGNEAILYSFVHSFISQSDRFYFTNEQLSSIFNISERSITDLLSKLKDRNLIALSYRRKSDGGQIRFVTMPTRKNFQYQLAKTASSKTQKLRGNYNKINDNNINNSEIEKKHLTQIDKIEDWAFARATGTPSCSRESFRKSLIQAITVAGYEKVHDLYSLGENGIAFLTQLKRL